MAGPSAEHLLRACRAVAPGVAGVVLASETGGVLGHEAGLADAHALAADALAQRDAALRLDPAAGASTLVRRASDLFLVVFVPPAVSAAWSA